MSLRVLKYFAIHIRFSAESLELACIIGISSHREINGAMYSTSVLDKATCHCNLVAHIIGHVA